MSNYLDHLIARHLDKSIVVQPRLASLFEPPHTGALPRAPRNVVESSEFDSSIEEHGAAGLLESRRSAEASFNADLHGSRTPASSDESLMAVWRGRQRILPTSVAEAGPTEPADLFIPVPVQPRPLHPQATTAKPTNEQSTNETAPGSFSNDGDAAPLQVVRQPVPTKIAPAVVQTDAREQSASLHLRQTGVEAAPVASTSKGHVAYPRIAARVDSRKATNDSPSPPDLDDAPPPPTINVTIGRVEVRATLPTPAPRRQSPAAPSMGLDEYLRRRAKGDER